MRRNYKVVDIAPPANSQARTRIVTVQTAAQLSGVAVLGSLGLFGLWMIGAFCVLRDSEMFENAVRIPAVIVPFWGTITGTILGFLFGRREHD